MTISILVKVNKNLGFGRNCRKILILVNIFGKISILVNIFDKIDLGQNFPHILVLVKISQNCQNLQICRFWSKKIKNRDFGQNFRKISILVNIYENLDLVQN